MHESIFAELSIVIALTAGVSLIMRLLRQPLILGYIIAGLIVGPSMLDLIKSHETFEAFSSIGIALLLFIIGLGMNVSVIKRLGKVVFITAAAELIAVGSFGYMISVLLGFSGTEALIVGLALFFSSTIIIVKVLTDKKEHNRLHGQIAIGVILLDDIVATFALLFVATGNNDSINLADIGTLVIKGVLVLGTLLLVSTKILPKFTKFIASSQELLFLFAISWGFGVASLFELAGYSIEVGALFAGVALAPLAYAQEIGARLKPLRDFFIVLFFIVLGESLNIDNLSGALVPALLLSLVVILLKPYIVMLSLGLLGYTKRVSFKTAINLSQISEFSIVLVVLAASSGLVSQEISAVITLVAIITIATSTYLMHYDEKLFNKFDRIKLNFFDHPQHHGEHHIHANYEIILFGYRKGGHEFARTFKQMGSKYVVVDYDPEVIETLEQQQIPYVYGDATDVELLEEIGIHSVKLVVSTVTDHESNEQLVQHVKHRNTGAVIITHADSQAEAVRLYELGSSYVMMPHYIGSEKISAFIKKNGLKKGEFNKYREKHLKYLNENYGVTEKKVEHDHKLGHAILEHVIGVNEPEVEVKKKSKPRKKKKVAA